MIYEGDGNGDFYHEKTQSGGRFYHGWTPMDTDADGGKVRWDKLGWAH